MTRYITYTIKAEDSNKKISSFLTERGFSSQNKTELKKIPQSVCRNGQWAYLNEYLTEGDVLSINIVENVSSPNIVPTSRTFDIVYEDEDIMVINKPAGMPIHPSQNHYEDTLANAVMYYFNHQHIPYVFRCINRLDRDTSGLTILAKHMVSGAILGRMVTNREIHREYLALVEGLTEEEGCINRAIGRVEGSTIARKIDEVHGEHAVTHYRRLFYQQENNVSGLLMWLETGRTHQIRVHMKSIGHPLLGDWIYNPDNYVMSRQALHSYRLTFLHPITKKQMVFVQTPPDDMPFLYNP